MALPTLVLVHGGGLAADCWDLTVAEIHRQSPELAVLAIDLPGRRGKPGDFLELTIADYVDSLVADIGNAGVGDIVIAAHSLGGMTVAGAAARLGASLVRELIFAAAFLPPEGKSVVDSSPWLFAQLARRRAKAGQPRETPQWLARFLYLNGVPAQRRRFMVGKLYKESLRITLENAPRREIPDEIPRTWILTRRDRALSPKKQRGYIDSIGGVQRLIEMDTCHCMMVSEPERLAEILIQRCGLYA